MPPVYGIMAQAKRQTLPLRHTSFPVIEPTIGTPITKKPRTKPAKNITKRFPFSFAAPPIRALRYHEPKRKRKGFA